jgi:GR25 family glycosyltransferase involved in LPS biosynthesis
MSDAAPTLACYVINLPRSVARRERMEAQLATMGLPFTLFPAIDGRAARDWLAAAIWGET